MGEAAPWIVRQHVATKTGRATVAKEERGSREAVCQTQLEASCDAGILSRVFSYTEGQAGAEKKAPDDRLHGQCTGQQRYERRNAVQRGAGEHPLRTFHKASSAQQMWLSVSAWSALH